MVCSSHSRATYLARSAVAGASRVAAHGAGRPSRHRRTE
uniref:Uncharacterized protein n=1 Tax=Arundo donax TaxID=35708 RepID=A0A0A9SZK1_ARUDO